MYCKRFWLHGADDAFRVLPAEKLEQAEGQLAHSGRTGAFYLPDKKKDDSQLAKISHDAAKTTVEQVKDIASQVIKDLLFNHRPPK
jgi:COP9 signalosome complex subunit 5